MAPVSRSPRASPERGLRHVTIEEDKGAHMVTIALVGVAVGALATAFRAADHGDRRLTLAALVTAVAAAAALAAGITPPVDTPLLRR